MVCGSIESPVTPLVKQNLDDMKKIMTVAAILVLSGCTATEKPRQLGMTNPASTYCVKQGGTLEIRTEPGGQVGYCHLPDGRVVEEWTLFRSARR